MERQPDNYYDQLPPSERALTLMSDSKRRLKVGFDGVLQRLAPGWDVHFEESDEFMQLLAQNEVESYGVSLRLKQ